MISRAEWEEMERERRFALSDALWQHAPVCPFCGGPLIHSRGDRGFYVATIVLHLRCTTCHIEHTSQFYAEQH